jgi:hypothetical protein
MSQSAVKAFNKSYLAQIAFSRVIITLAICGLAALALLKLVEFIPNSDTWAMWISILVALLGVALHLGTHNNPL